MQRRTEIIITESALDALIAYYQKSTENAQRIKKTLDLLKGNGTKSQIYKIKESQRPIWQCQIGTDCDIYFTIGSGAKCSEIRINFFGPPIKKKSSSYRQLLYLAGEAPYYEIPDEVLLEDEKKVDQYPPFPFRKFKPAASLNSYLNPDEDEQLEVLEKEQENIDDLNGRPYRILRDIRPPINLPIRLSPQQERLLHEWGPIFLQGVAGSGKTTLLTYFAHQELIRTNNRAKILIIAYTEPLKFFIQGLLRSLDTLEPVDFSRIEIYTWRELCNLLADEVNLDPLRWLDNQHNLEFQAQCHLKGGTPNCISPIELEEFIRAILKGDSTTPDSALVDKKSFFNMPPTAMDHYIDRRDIYEIAEKYQSFLHINFLVDDMDVARLLLSKKEKLPAYDCVLIDETQDYTMVQLRLVATLSKSSDNLIFVGDMNQVLYPSHFNWEKARSSVWHVWKVNPPEKKSIDYNYRNPQPVNDIANKLLSLRRKKLNIDHVRSARSNQAMTPEPLRILVYDEELDEIITALASSIGSLGIITDQVKEIKIEGIEFERIFTPKSVKGIEFNVVCLINFNEIYNDLIIEGKSRHTPRELFLMFNEVYVSVTRTRGQLLLIDKKSNKNGLWSDSFFSKRINIINRPEILIKTVKTRFQLKNKDEWKIAALDFEGQKAFASAAECWARAGKPEKAATSYEKADQLTKALQIYKTLNNLKAAARLLEKLKRYSEAAEYYYGLKRYKNSAICWVQGKNYLKAASVFQEMAEKSQEPDVWYKAGVQYRNAKSFKNAAISFEKAKRLGEAAIFYEKVQCWDEAATCFENEKQWEHAAICFQKSKNWDRAAVYFEKLKQLENAASCFEKAENWDRSISCYQKAGQWLGVAEGYQKLKQSEQAAIYFEKAKHWDRAAVCYEKLKRWYKAAECYKKNEDWEQSANCFKTEEKWEDAAECFEKAGKWERAAVSFENAKIWAQAGECYEKSELWKQAIVCFKKISDMKRIAFCADKADPATSITDLQITDYNFEKHLLTINNEWFQFEKFERSERLWNMAKKISNTNKFYEETRFCMRNGNYYKAGELYFEAGNHEMAAECMVEAKDYTTASLIFIDSDRYFRAARLLNLIDETELANMCLALHWECQGDRIRADVFWKKIKEMRYKKGYEEHKEKLVKMVEKIKYPSTHQANTAIQSTMLLLKKISAFFKKLFK